MSLLNSFGKSVKKALDNFSSKEYPVKSSSNKKSGYVSPSNPSKPYYSNPSKSGNDFLNPINNPSSSSNKLLIAICLLRY